LWLTVAALLLGCGLATAAAPDAIEIDRLIQQMGSDEFAQRESAARALDTIGEPALGALKKAAATAEDMEIRRRSEDLVKVIEKRAETTEILKATTVKLHFQDTPVAEAVAELARQANYTDKLVLAEAAKAQLANRKVTLDTAEVTFWEALDKLCVAAQLTEQTGAAAGQPNLGAVPADIAPVGPNGVAAPAVARVIRPPIQPNPGVNFSRITLTDGKPTVVPTCYAGAVRIRLAPTANAPKQNNEVTLTLEITPEPKLQWYGHTAIRLETAVDEGSREFRQVAMLDDQGGVADMNGNVVVMAGGGQIVVQGGGQVVIQGQNVVVNGRQVIMNRAVVPGAGFVARPGLPAGGGQQGFGTVRLKVPENGGKTLRALRGLVFANVQTPMQTLGGIDNILQATDKSFTTKDGSQFTVKEAAKQDNGDVRVRVQMGQGANGFGGNVIIQGGVQPGFPGGAPQQRDLVLTGEDGKAYQLISSRDQYVANAGGVASLERHMIFRPAGQNAAPKKLEYRGSRVAVVEIPFELKSVPLP